MEIFGAIVVGIVISVAPIMTWWDTRYNKKQLKTTNGTTTAQYAEQTHDLVRILSRQMEDHVTNERVHYASS